MSLKPSSLFIDIALLDLIRIEHGKIIEQWGGPDLFDMLKQLGAKLPTGSQ